MSYICFIVRRSLNDLDLRQEKECEKLETNAVAVSCCLFSHWRRHFQSRFFCFVLALRGKLQKSIDLENCIKSFEFVLNLFPFIVNRNRWNYFCFQILPWNASSCLFSWELFYWATLRHLNDVIEFHFDWNSFADEYDLWLDDEPKEGEKIDYCLMLSISTTKFL